MDRIIKAENPFQLHVAVIMFQSGVEENKAKFIAWQEGKEGLTNRVDKSCNKQIITIAENMGV